MVSCIETCDFQCGHQQSQRSTHHFWILVFIYASCKPNSCNNRGECMETVGGYKCRCDEGFYGPECEFVKQCAILRAPVQAKMLCSHPIGNFSFNSMCDFHCAAGFTLQGSQSLQCTAAGRWTAEAPSCEAVKCGNLEIPEKGFMNCSHPFRDFSYKSACTFSCDKGFELRGSDRIQCGTSGQWNGQKPTCEAIQCENLEFLGRGIKNCTHSTGQLNYSSTCRFCGSARSELHGSGTQETGALGNWTTQSPTTEVYPFDKMWEPHKSTAATVGTAFTLLLLSFIVWGIIRRYRKAKQEKTPLARNEDNLETTAV